MKTGLDRHVVHVVLNAHLDPSWLWPWQAGLDEALATCRSACDRLDAHPDIVFTRGEAWVYRQVQACEPDLFERIRRHAEEGRWRVVGGWWVQPDCNGPSSWGMDRQVELGLDYFGSEFGLKVRTAYNVDTFGHSAFLPELLTSHGQDRYVMMRPQEHEKELPARIFRWRGYPDGPEVRVFRIAGSYCTGSVDAKHIEKALTELPAGCCHTMCFCGVGDHGGGPTESQIRQIRELASSLPGVSLEFSHPDRFFDCIEAECVELPLVVGELQHHAVGCYTVCHSLKTSVRRAEHAMKSAEGLLSEPTKAEAWRRIAFSHFHDIYGGTCIPSAYPQIEDDLGYARSAADQALQVELRRRCSALPDDADQRIVLWNASDREYSDYVEFEPWLERQCADWGPGEAFELVDEDGDVPVQKLAPEAAFWGVPRLLFHVDLPAGGQKVLKLRAPHSASGSAAESSFHEAALGWAADSLLLSDVQCPLPKVLLLEDTSDTWSHNVDRLGEGPAEEARWGRPVAVDRGPLMASYIYSGDVGETKLRAEWRAYAGEPFVQLSLDVHWAETRKVLKLAVAPPHPSSRRIDGVMGGLLERENDGAERPLRDFTVSGGVGIACPEVYALDGTPESIRLTLLRSPVMAHHLPHDGRSPRAVVSDQGVHRFRFRFYGADASPDRLDRDACSMQRPLIVADLTRGMNPVG